MQLTVDKLAIHRGERCIFADMDFCLPGGSALVVTGPNGSGKSTLLKAIAGFLPASAGSIRLEGGDSQKRLGEHCHYLAHGNALKPQLSVGENLEFWHAFLGAGETAAAALSAVGLDGISDLPAGYLSAGQKRRVAIARLLVSHRPLWLVDEPTAALDAASEARFAEIVKAHLAKGGMVVAATHQPLGLDDAARLDLSSRNLDNRT